jgi:hypothetical protein
MPADLQSAVFDRFTNPAKIGAFCKTPMLLYHLPDSPQSLDCNLAILANIAKLWIFPDDSQKANAQSTYSKQASA